MDMSAASKRIEIKIFRESVNFRSDVKARWNVLSDYGIEFLVFYFLFLNMSQRHSAADVNANEIWNDRFPYCHSQTDGSDLTRVHIRHHAYTASIGTFLITNHLKL